MERTTKNKKIIIILFSVIGIGVMLYISFLSINLEKRETMKPVGVKNISSSFENITFYQLKGERKIWTINAKKVNEKDKIIILEDVSGIGQYKYEKNFSFSAGEVVLNKKDYSFKAKNNVTINLPDKKIKSDIMIYNSIDNYFLIPHGIIYLQNGINLKGKNIKYFIKTSELKIGGAK